MITIEYYELVRAGVTSPSFYVATTETKFVERSWRPGSGGHYEHQALAKKDFIVPGFQQVRIGDTFKIIS